PEACAISRANAQEVAKFIYKDIIYQHGCPSILLSDQGSHFNNCIIDKLLAAMSTKHHCSTLSSTNQQACGAF
ncbi:1732_t:CDS:1, partial [Gigaspora rosea]